MEPVQLPLVHFLFSAKQLTLEQQLSHSTLAAYLESPNSLMEQHQQQQQQQHQQQHKHEHSLYHGDYVNRGGYVPRINDNVTRSG